MSLIKASVVLLFLLSLVTNINGKNRYKVTLAIYYESRSPQSRFFILNQALPAAIFLKQYLNIRLIPFGNARFIDETKAICTNGNIECEANAIHECTLHILEKAGKSSLERLKFVACEMKNNAIRTYYFPECTKMNKSSMIYKCVPYQGLVMQKNSEYRTRLLPTNSFPVVSINGIYNQELDKRAKHDLIRTLCSFARMPPCLNQTEVSTESSAEIDGDDYID